MNKKIVNAILILVILSIVGCCLCPRRAYYRPADEVIIIKEKR